MKKFLFILSLGFLNGFYGNCQKLLGNEWINYDQNYLKITIDKPGVYRIFKKDLVQFGLYSSEMNPKNLKLIYRGKEIAILVNGENDNKFDDSDFIEFYAKKNDGALDSLVYRPHSARPNKYLSIFSEKTSYFLMYDQNQGKRIQTTEFLNKNLIADEYYYVEKLKVYNEDWNFDLSTGGVPSLAQSYFEPNETLVSTPFFFDNENNKFEETINLPNYNSNTEISVNYESMISSRYFPKKTISVNIGDKNRKVQIEDYKLLAINETITNLSNSTLKLRYSIESTNSSNILDGKKYDLFSVLYFKIRYPSKTIFENNQEIETKANLKGETFLKLSNANDKIIIYNIDDFNNQIKIIPFFDSTNNVSNVYIKNTEKGKKIFLTSRIDSPHKIEKVVFKKLESKDISYIIIADSTLKEGAVKFKAYRESENGGKHSVQIGIKQNIFDEFNYGERNPYAIHNYLEYLFENGKPKYLLLLGKARSTPSFFKVNELEDFTPTMGFPASDVLLSAGLNGKGIDFQALATGRVAAIKNEEIINYLEKVIDFEANKSNEIWKKRVLHLGGGRGESQIVEFKKFLGSLGEISKNGKLGSVFTMLNKQNALVGTENIDISKKVNEGIGIITFFGHSSSLALDLNIGYVSDEKANFKNGPNYPFMFFNGCAAGNVFQRAQSLSNDWIITPQKGAIAVLAHSFLSYSNTNTTYMEKLYKTWFSSTEMLNKPIGEVVMRVNEVLIKSNPNDIYMIANTQQMILQGDPAIKIFNFNKPDFKISDDKIFLISDTPNKTIGNSSKIKLSVVAENLGIYDIGVPINVKLKKTYQDNKIEEQIKNLKSFGVKDTLIFSIDNDLSLKSIEIAFDSDFQIDEINEDNNKATFNFNWEKLKNLDYFSTSPFEDIINPILNVKYQDNLIYDGIKLKADDILDISLIDNLSLGNKADKITIFLKKVCDSCNETLNPIVLNSISGGSNELFSAIKLEKLAPGNYQLFIQGFDAKNNSSGEVYSINFTIEPPNEKFDLNVHPNPISIFTNFEIFAPQKSNFELKIYNTQGKNVFSKTGQLYYGKNEIFWNAKDNQLNSMPNGLYLYNLIVNSTEMLRFQGKFLLNN